MATINEEIRLLAGDLEESSNPFLTDTQLRILQDFNSYQDDANDWHLNILLCAVEYCRNAVTFHPDMTPEQSTRFKQHLGYLQSLLANPAQASRFVRDFIAPLPTTFPLNPGDEDTAQAIAIHNQDPAAHPSIDIETQVLGAVQTHNAAQAAHGIAISHHNTNDRAHGSVEEGLSNHIANHPGSTVAGPPGPGTVGRDQLTSALRGDIDGHLDTTAFTAHTTGHPTRIYFTDVSDSNSLPTPSGVMNGDYLFQMVSSDRHVIQVYLRAGGVWQSSGFPGMTLTQENIYDAVNHVMQQGTGIRISRSDANHRLTITNTGGGEGGGHVGRRAFLGAQAVYTDNDDTLTVNAQNDAPDEPNLGDTIIFQLPNTLDGNDRNLNLAVQYTGGTSNYPLQNSHGDPITTNELLAGATLEAIHVLIGTDRKWRMVEPPIDLTEAQVTDGTSTLFGVVSGQRLSQAVAANSPNVDVYSHLKSDLVEGDNVTLTADDANGTITIASTGGGGGEGRSLEELQDAVAAMFANVSEVTYDDGAGTFSITFPQGGTPRVPLVIPRVIGGGVHLWRVGSYLTNGQSGQVHSPTGGYVVTNQNGWAITDDDALDIETVMDGLDDHYYLPTRGSQTFPFSRISGRDYDTLSDRPIFRVGHASSIEASASTVGRRYQTNDGLQYVVERQYVAGNDRVLAFELYPLAGATGFQGSVNDSGDLSLGTLTSADEGKWWMVRTYLEQGTAPFVLIDSNGSPQSVAHIPDMGFEYLGHYRSRAEAEADADVEMGSVCIFPDAQGLTQLYRPDSTFVAGTPAHTAYLIVPTDLPPNFAANLNHLLTGFGGPEMLYDNRDSDTTALSLTQGTSMWSRTFDLELSRALTEADDDKEIKVQFTYDQVTAGRYFEVGISARAFRDWTPFATTTGEAGFPVGNIKFPINMGRTSGSNTIDGVWNRQAMIFRGSVTNGNDVLRIIIPAGDSQTYAAISNMRGCIKLVTPGGGAQGPKGEPGDAGVAFDLHDDVTVSLPSVGLTDRFVVSDEGTADDPMRYMTVSQFRTWLNSNLSLSTARITSGTFSTARIPSLGAGQITSGTFDADRIPNLNASKINAGTLDEARIPDLAASKITSGTFGVARIPAAIPRTVTAGGGAAITGFWRGTQDEYDALTPDANTVYLVTAT